MNLPGVAAAAVVLAAALAAGVRAPQQAIPQNAAEEIAARENAHRASNVGVALLEQFDFPAAVQAFRRALTLQPGLSIARINLAIAHFYAGELEPAKREAEAARAASETRRHADYLLGLIARAENRTADAVEAFERVRQADASDLGAAINLGQLYTQQQKFTGAIELFRQAMRLEPYNTTAAYGMATALLRSGARDEGAAAMAKFQQLRDSGYATAFSQVYLEQGRYAAAIASTGAEPGLVDKRSPEVRFADATSEVISPPLKGGARGIALVDADADGDLDAIVATGEGLRLLRNTKGKFVEAPAGAFPRGAAGTGVVAGDYDNDGRADLFALSSERGRLLRQRGDGTFEDVTAKAGIPGAAAVTAAWADADHDGDLDLLFSGGATRLLRNNGNGSFADITAEAGIPAAARALSIAPVDFDNRRDIDFLLLRSTDAPLLLRNLRDGSFRDAAPDTGLPSETSQWSAMAAGDVNKDGFVDFFFGRPNAAGVFALSDGSGRFRLDDAPAATAQAMGALFADYDNDGLLDLIVVSPRATPVVLRNAGGEWIDETGRAFAGRTQGGTMDSESTITAGDLDGDGDTDLLEVEAGSLVVWRNEGGNRHPSIAVRLAARVSNRSALGARVEMRAGSLTQQLDAISATPAVAAADLIFGLGPRKGADVVRVLWPAGILQAEVAAPASGGAADSFITGQLTVRELDRKPSSCPYLFTWNGRGFEFVTDFLGSGELGYWVAPGVRNTPDPDEYVRITSEQLQARDGRYELRVTNELEEAVFLDRVQLLAIAHAGDTEVYPQEGMGGSPQPFGIHAVRGARPPLAARDDDGRDLLSALSAVDRTYADGFALESIRGYAKPHSLTLTLPSRPPGARLLLLLTGWTDYAFSRDNVAASQAGLRLVPPALEIRDGAGGWRTVVENLGVPVGRPQTVPVDLTDLVPPDGAEVRITTTMRIYWDRILVDTSGAPAPSEIVRLEPLDAQLRWRGFSAERSPDGREPLDFDYSRVRSTSPWKLLPGRYTREGDVRELVTAVDDMFVVSRPGDDIALAFDARALPPLREGWTRTFLLYAHGYSKEMDPHSASPDVLAPLPFRAMTRYPYPASERYPETAAHREYVERYNTRVVPRSLPLLCGCRD